ncbi:MAG: iron-containing redox enzyme family protein [Burkholderiales bacterium]|nr:MAG: iron-containing redox enzyme family protein [Burkholderiales bacterium]
MNKTFIHTVQETVDAEWAKIKRGAFWRRVMSEPVPMRLYRDLMLQVYHYSRHNSMNQAVAAFQPAPEGLLKFVYKHAAEELGHERMVIHDLKSIGMFDEADLQKDPLPATEALIGYLYSVALRYGAVARLGYSFWAEGVYGHIAEPFGKISKDLALTSKNLTFFGSHAQADEAHIQQVTDAIERFATTPADQSLVLKVARTTLFLTGQLIEQVAAQHPAGAARP